MPEGWREVQVGDCLATQFPGEWGGPPSGGGNAIVLRSTDIDDDGHVALNGARRQIPAAKLLSKRLEPGDLLLEASGGGPGKPVGRVALFRGGDGDAYVCSNFFRTLRPAQSVAADAFLCWRLQYLYRQPAIWVLQQQTTGIINLKYRDYLASKLQLPPLPEQRKIAEILDTVDEAIRKTEQIIAKLEQVKQGLLHDLLTRGIDDNGELRDPTRHPEHFKDSELGRIPRSWQVGSIGSLCAIHNNLRKPISVEVRDAMSGVFPYYGPTGILDYIDEHRIEGTFVLIGEDGDHFLKFASWSMTQLVSGRFNVNNHAHVISGIGCRTDWLDTWFCHRDITLYLTRQGAGRFKLNKKSLQSMLLAVPTESEQVGIRQALQAAAGRANGEKHTLEKLRLLKQGLMEDLLTGHVRVNPLLETAE